MREPSALRLSSNRPPSIYLSLLASRSDSSRQRMSSSRTVYHCQLFASRVCMQLFASEEPLRLQGTPGIVYSPGPLTLRMMLRVWSSMNSTRTWVTPPREPVRMQLSVWFRVVSLPACLPSNLPQVLLCRGLAVPSWGFTHPSQISCHVLSTTLSNRISRTYRYGRERG